jgi:microcystin-dependent protein
MLTPFLGQITVYPYNFAPKGWIACEGQILPISQYTALFSLLGTNYGGNGTSNFGLPDLRGRLPLGMGTLTGGGDYVIGEIAGEESVTLTQGETQHTHSLDATTAAGTLNTPSGAVLASPFVGGRTGPTGTGAIYNPGTPNVSLVPASVAASGSSLAHNNIQPSLVLRPCIALSGVFPARN